LVDRAYSISGTHFTSVNLSRAQLEPGIHKVLFPPKGTAIIQNR